MNQDPVSVKRIDWSAVLPGLHLLKALRFAYRFRTLAPAACAVMLVGLLLVVLGYPMASAFSTDYKSSFLQKDADVIDFVFSPDNPQQVLFSSSWRLMQPPEISIPRLIILCVLAQAIVFGFGIGICRAVACEFCVEQRSGAWSNLKLSLRSSPSALAAAAAFFLLCFAAMLPVLAVRTYVWLAGNEGVLGTVWPIIALFSIPAVLIWALVMLSGPLAAAAIATDDCGVADGVSRAFCYVFSHKLPVLLLLFASTALAWMCSAFAQNLLSLSMSISAYGLPENVTQLKSTLWGTQQSNSVGLTVLTRLIATTVQFAVWQSSFAIGYVLLRKKEDGISYREISR